MTRYIYTAQCPQTGSIWQLPRTREIEIIAQNLMQQLAADGPDIGNLYGVLLAQSKTGDRVILKGFSGLLAGQHERPGWVPPISADAQLALLETQTLAKLDRLKQQLIELQQLPVRTTHKQIFQQYAKQLQQMASSHRQRKQERDRTRTHYNSTLKGEALAQALDTLKRASQQDTGEYRRLKQTRNQALSPLHTAIAQAEHHIRELKQQYVDLSQQWQTQLRTAYEANRLGIKANKPGTACHTPLAATCQRAAAKLLHYAAIQNLQPIALAEFWWETSQKNFESGQFYQASPEDCRTLMAIAQMSVFPVQTTNPLTVSILYQDDAIIVVDKPPGLLSVPGRRYELQDSVLSRLRYQLPNYNELQVVHRLDQATSGILVLATSSTIHKALGQQFAQQQVHKTYEAVLSRPIVMTDGVIHLPLWGDPDERPKQLVNKTHGKPSVTYFQVLQKGTQPRVQFVPHTGRTHQLRVHAAHPQGLNSPILGDSLYGRPKQAERLYLHATSLKIRHPVSQKSLEFSSDVPF